MRRLAITIASVCVFLSGCAQFETRIEQSGKDARQTLAEKLPSKSASDKKPSESVVRILPGSYVGVRRVATPDQAAAANRRWLTDKMVTVNPLKPVQVTEIVKSLRAQGLNITTSLPLSSYSYSGYGVTNIDGETALKMLLGASGLDYKIDDAKRVVTVTPMASRTWYINIGNRRTSYISGTGSATAATQGQGGGAAQTGAGTGGGYPMAGQSIGQTPSMGGMPGGGQQQSGTSQTGAGAGTTGAGSSAGNSVTISDDFWSSLRQEINTRVSILVPTAQPSPENSPSLIGLPTVPALSGQSSAPPSQYGSPANGAPAQPQNLSYERKLIGTYSVNPETGSIVVQAPHWMLDDIGEYVGNVQAMYNAEMTFTGEIFMVTTDHTKTEGLDIAAFGRFARDRYGAVIQNNQFSGVTVSFPTAGSLIPNVSAPQSSLPIGTMLGVGSVLDGVQIFNAYLSQLGAVKVVQKPILSTTSGVPGEFSKMVTKYWSKVSQTAAAGGTGSAAVGTQNELVPVEIGTLLRIYPRYDIKDQLIRAQMTLKQYVQTGTQDYVQFVTTNGATQPITSKIPTVNRMDYSGEALMRDGDLIVMGGMTEDNQDDGLSGVTGLSEGPFAPLFGQKRLEKHANTYYFALTVRVNKKSEKAN